MTLDVLEVVAALQNSAEVIEGSYYCKENMVSIQNFYKAPQFLDFPDFHS